MRFNSLVLSLSLATLAVACGRTESQSQKTDSSSKAFTGSTISNLLLTVKTGQDVDACAAQIKALPGTSVGFVLKAIGVITAQTSSLDRSKIEALDCIQHVEVEGAKSIAPKGPSASGTVSAAVLSEWLVGVKDGVDIDACAAEVHAAGAEIKSVLKSIRIITAQTPSADKSAIEALTCVHAVEAEKTSTGSGISGATN